MKELKDLYEEYGYPSAERLWKLVKKENLSFTKKQVQEFVSEQISAQLHRRAPKVRQVPITASDVNFDWQIDLLDMNKYHKSNEGYRWILIVVDVFSRKAAAVALKKKTADEATNALIEVIDKMGKPLSITSDDGSEFKGAFKKLLAEKNIAHRVTTPGDHNVLGIIDRFSKTLKLILHRHFTQQQTVKWIDVLQRFIQAYNKTEHASLHMSPNEAKNRPTDARNVHFENLQESQKARSVQKFKVGDHVRVKRKKRTFDRGYEIVWSLTVYTIQKIEGQNYLLSDGKKYRAHMLQRVSKSPEKAQQIAEKPKQVPEKSPDIQESVQELPDSGEKTQDLQESLPEHQVSAPEPQEQIKKNKNSARPKTATVQDVARKAKFEHRTDRLLESYGLDRKNRRSGLRERAPTNLLEDSRFGRIFY
jgi:transposase InsO family protein